MQAIAIIHHLSSSGGTVFSKCIAAQPDVVLLSEVHPLTGMGRPFFLPMDPLAQFLVNYPRLRPGDETLNHLFRRRLELVARTCNDNGKFLVLRDHSHSDYLSGRQPRQRLADALASHYELRRFVTVRNPIDAWLSMKESKFDRWVTGFEDYCGRVLTFLDDHEGLPLWTYEEFVTNPNKVISEVCAYLAISFDETFIGRFTEIALTGDSGRKPAQIAQLPRRAYPREFIEEIANSRSFSRIAERIGYEIPAPMFAEPQECFKLGRAAPHA